MCIKCCVLKEDCLERNVFKIDYINKLGCLSGPGGKTRRNAAREFHSFFFLARHLPRCQIGVLAGLLSTSHFRLTDIPSTIGIPKPGKRVIANDGVSETGIKQLVSMPRRRCTLISQRNIKRRERERKIEGYYYVRLLYHRAAAASRSN